MDFLLHIVCNIALILFLFSAMIIGFAILTYSMEGENIRKLKQIHREEDAEYIQEIIVEHERKNDGRQITPTNTKPT